MKRRTIINLFGEDGKSMVIDEREGIEYEIPDALVGCLKMEPEESFILRPEDKTSVTIVTRSSHTKALAICNGTCIGTKKELRKVPRQELSEGDIFFCAWTDPYGQSHFIWIENMEKKYQNCTVSIAGYEPDEVSRLSQAILWAMLQAKARKKDKYKAFLEKEFGIYKNSFMIEEGNGQ